MSTAARPPYSVRIRSRRVQRELDAVPRNDIQRVLAAIRNLANSPRPARSVRLDGNIFRIRIGRYRVIYQVDDDLRTVNIGGVRRRNEGTYRRIRDLFSS